MYYNANIKSEGPWSVAIHLIDCGVVVGFIKLRANSQVEVRSAVMLAHAFKSLPPGVKLHARADRWVPGRSSPFINRAVIGEVKGDGEVVIYPVSLDPRDDAEVMALPFGGGEL
jgi:hypothetical protein